MMRIAVPLSQGNVSLHFGHCDQFAVVDVDPQNKQISKIEKSQPPSHQPGALPEWLQQQNVDLIIAGGMGRRAQSLFEQYGIELVLGAQGSTVEGLIDSYIQGTLETGDNICDH